MNRIERALAILNILERPNALEDSMDGDTGGDGYFITPDVRDALDPLLEMSDGEPERANRAPCVRVTNEGEVFDDELYTHKETDVLYIRYDHIWEYFLSLGYKISVALKDKEDD